LADTSSSSGAATITACAARPPPTSPALPVLQIAVATGPAQETPSIGRDDERVPVLAPVGRLVIGYSAGVDGSVPVPPGTGTDRIARLRPTRSLPVRRRDLGGRGTRVVDATDGNTAVVELT
jgi:hypothetical protein